MAVIPTGYAQVNIQFSGVSLDGTAEVTYGVANTTGLDAADIAEACSNMWASEGMAGFHVAAVVVNNVHVKRGPNLTGQQGDYGTSIAGELSGDAMPGNVASLVRKNTVDGGRAGVGRMFIPGLSEGSVAGNSRWDPTQLAARQADLNAWFAAHALADLEMVVLHGESSPISTPSLITSLVLDPLLATQRRRLRR